MQPDVPLKVYTSGADYVMQANSSEKQKSYNFSLKLLQMCVLLVSVSSYDLSLLRFYDEQATDIVVSAQFLILRPLINTDGF